MICFQAQAWDGMLTGSTVVEISVVDLNDNYPVFTQDSYSFTIAENNDVDQALNTGSAILVRRRIIVHFSHFCINFRDTLVNMHVIAHT